MVKENRRTLISIVVPCHNEEANIQPFYSELTGVIDPLPADFEIIFVDDGSSDTTVAKASHLERSDHRVRVVELVRNFGKEIATTAGFNAADGDAAISIDADLQHPPALIPKLIEPWQNGAEVVVGLRRETKSYAPKLKRWGSAAFHGIMHRLSETDVRRGATDYRLIDRSVINEFNRFTERNRITRGLIDWLGFRRAYVEFVPAERRHGEAAYSYYKLVKLALNSFVAMSMLPLRLAGYVGGVMTIVAGTLGLFIFIEKYLLHDPLNLNFTGPAILGVVIIFMVGIMLICLGLIALYIATIHTEAVNRPLYVTRTRKRRRGTSTDDAIVPKPPVIGSKRG